MSQLKDIHGYKIYVFPIEILYQFVISVLRMLNE